MRSKCLGGAIALAAVLVAGSASAKTCALSIEANDQMQYNKKELTAEKSCTEIKLTLKHTGKLPKTAMGHDWVLTKAADKAAVLTDGAKAGMMADFIPPSDKRIIAHTKLIGGGQSDTVTFSTKGLKAGGDYTYFCTFPGHAATMTGKFIYK